MRKIKSVLLALALCISVLSSCKKEDGDSSSSVYLSAKVDGSLKEGKDSKVAVISQTGIGIMIVGNFGSATETLTLILPEDATAKDYSLVQVNGDADAYAFYVNGTNEADQYDAVSGTIKVTAITATNIEGTFNFVGKNEANASKTVTEGKFKVKR